MRMIFSMKTATALTMILASGTLATAQTTGNVNGQVKDPKGAPVAGAVLTISSPALFAPKTVTTNDKGEYFVPLLPPGSYVIKVSKQGFNGVSSPELRLGLGASIRQDVVLRPTVVVSEVVEVIASGGTQVDKADSKVSTNFSADNLSVLAAPDRSFVGALALTPGVSQMGNGTTTIRGGASNATLFRVNGVDIKDDLQGQQVGSGAIEDLIEDVQVMVSPLNARFGRTMGGQVNVITKSGGNDFKGSIRSTFDRASWNARDRDVRAIDYANQLDDLGRRWDIVATGPIIKDRLWFSVGTTLTPTANMSLSLPVFGPASKYNRAYVTGDANIDNVTKVGPSGYQFTAFDAGLSYKRTDTNKYYEGKLTGAITQDHTVEAYYKLDKNEIANRDPYSGGGSCVSLVDLGTQSSESTTIGVGYKGTLSSFAFLEASYSRNRTDITWPVGARSAQYPDPILFRIFDVQSEGRWAFNIPMSPAPEIRANRSGNVNLKLFLSGAGTHDIDLGVDFYMGEYGTSSKSGANNRVFRSGGAYVNGSGSYLFPTMVFPGRNTLGQSGSGLTGIAPTLVKYYGQDGTGQTIQQSLYANDAITVNEHWNLMAGFRLNRNIIKNTDKSEVASTNNFEPRFEVKYDPFGTSMHVFSASAARLYSAFNTGFTSLFMSQASSVYTYHAWKGIAGQPAAGSANDNGLYGVRFVDYATLTNEANYGNAFNYGNSSKKYWVDSALRAPYAQELTLNYTRASETGRVRLSLVHRTWHDDFARMDDYRADNFVQVEDPSGMGSPSLIIKSQIFNSNDLKREYNAVEVEWNKKISRAIEWGGNVTYSRLVGNSNGGDDPGSSFRDNSPTGYYGNRAYLLSKGFTDRDFAPNGLLPLNQTLKARAYLNLIQPLGKGRIAYSFAANYDTGLSYSAFNTAPLGMKTIPSVGGVPVVDAKPLTFDRYYSDRGAYSLNDQYSVDFRLSWDVPLGLKNLALIGDLKVNNLFNHIIWADWNRDFYSPINGAPVLWFSDASIFGRPMEHTTDASNGNFHVGARNFSFSIGLRF